MAAPDEIDLQPAAPNVATLFGDPFINAPETMFMTECEVTHPSLEV